MRIEAEPAYKRGRRKCEKRNWSLKLLDSILSNYVANKGFNEAEIIKYHDHALKGKWKGHREFHPYGRSHNWIVVYHIENDTIVLDDTGDGSVLVLDHTGSHDEVFGTKEELKMEKLINSAQQTNWPSEDTWYAIEDDERFEDMWQDYLCDPEDKVNEEFQIFPEPSVQGGSGLMFLIDDSGEDRFEPVTMDFQDWSNEELRMAASSNSAKEYEEKYREFISELLPE